MLPHSIDWDQNFASQGWAILPAWLKAPDCVAIAAQADSLHQQGAGRRDVLAQSWCVALLQAMRQLPALQTHLHGMQAVQCSYFAKSADCNWLVPLHQDLSVPVAARNAHPALRGWSCKDGQLFVQPPSSLLARMLALRLHLDAVDAENGALRVLNGSHVGEYADAASARAACGETLCSAEAGSLMLMRPRLWHASGKITAQRQRRVLHFLFGPQAPGFGLCWPSDASR
ncbi:phytanoyl-CoA dioxygenase family protein [Massilia sp. W12]|uniref:phytanoyl-CoA dioxygenase family protein n=1 Tax=Massilia sp. W12 TaxID=3126507 RepID=UPI0030D1AC0B